MSTPSPTPFFDVRLRGFGARTAVDDAVGRIRQRTGPLGSEMIELAAAAGRVLAADVVAAVPVPHFDRSAFDGYAVRAEETAPARPDAAVTLALVGEALPGRPLNRPLGPGEAIRIMTGAPVPAGATAVIPFEKASEADGQLPVTEPIPVGKNVSRVGEDVPAGRTVLTAGRVLRPQDVGLLASIGVGRVAAVRRPRVAILVTGDELLPPGARPTGYQIVDSNSVVLRALVERDGGEPLPTRPVPDSPPAIRAAMEAGDWDVFLVSGGTSVGREDHAPRLLADVGELPVHGVALRPAGPTGIGFVGGRPVFLLPGNPVSSLCAYDLFAGRAVRRLGGRSDVLPHRTVEAPAAGPIPSAVGRADYVRVRVSEGGVEPLAVRGGASNLSTTVIADGFVLVPGDRDGYAPGEVVTVYLY